MKKLLKIISLGCIAVLCACGTAACAETQPEAVNEVTIEQLIEANDRLDVVKEYGNLHITESLVTQSDEEYSIDTYFTANDYGLVLDSVDEKSDGTQSYYTSVIDGMMYNCNKSSQNDELLALIVAGEINLKIFTRPRFRAGG